MAAFSLTNLTKANVLIDQRRRARLGDFGLLTILSDPTNLATPSSTPIAGTTRFMSPELLDSDQFGQEDGRPTNESDCYALGMVILEVLSGQAPYKQFKEVIVMRLVLDGKLPERPDGQEGMWFTDDIWRTLERCWSFQSKDRPTVNAVLKLLRRASTTWHSPPPGVDDSQANAVELRSAIGVPCTLPPLCLKPCTQSLQ